MSDGPHKSLPMRRNWRRVAEHADKPAWSPDAVGADMRKAVSRDYEREITPKLVAQLKAVIGATEQYSLFADEVQRQLAVLNAIEPAGSFEEALVVHTELAIRAGQTGDAALHQAVVGACSQRASEYSRSMEEHYLQKAGRRSAEQLRDRLQQGLSSSAFQTVAQGLLSPEPDSTTNTNSTDTGLDAGPELAR